MSWIKKKIRCSQAVTTYGVGTLIDFDGEGFIFAGIDAWPFDPESRIEDPRLSRRLKVEYFRAPPVEREEGGSKKIPALRFPCWYSCPVCHSLKRVSQLDRERPRCVCPPKPGRPTSRKGWRMIPVNFVTVCEAGHLDEFPWVAWAHAEEGSMDGTTPCSPEPKLRLIQKGIPGLKGLEVVCDSCGKKNTLLNAAGERGVPGASCRGAKPWLGAPDGLTGEAACTKAPRMLTRAASNLHYSKLASSILIPPYSDRLRKLVDNPKIWSALNSSVQADGSIPADRIQLLAEIEGVDPSEFSAAVNAKIRGQATEESTEEEFRYSEYRALCGKHSDRRNQLVTSPQDLSRYESWFQKYVERAVLVSKLTETRAFTGFSRLTTRQDLGGSVDDWSMLSRRRLNWLPAVRVHGEGIFLTFNEARLEEWSRDPNVFSFYQRIAASYNSVQLERNRPARQLPPKFFLLHTLAHAIMRQLSYECGYGTSSLRERLYVSDAKDTKMNGLLIYTSAGDVEGTLGGLVGQGKHGRLEPLIKRALEDALWCSSDPLCMESNSNSRNGAACYACALAPETSCEEGNFLLDRGALVGNLSTEMPGFFEELVAGMVRDGESD